MATVKINFEFSNGCDSIDDCAEFDADGLLIAAITEYADDRASELNDDLADVDEDNEDAGEWECTGWEVEDWESDLADLQGPEDFKDLDEWGDYADVAERYGNAYCLRYADVGEHDFDDEYNGCWDSFEDFARNFIDDCYDLDGPLASYFDYERFASDLEMDYSTYEDSEGVHVFRC